MIGKVVTTKDIPAGSCIHYDTIKNTLVIFDPVGFEVFAIAKPFAVEGTEADPRIERI